MENTFGLLISEPKPTDYMFGGGQVAGQVLQPNGQWHDYLPIGEKQHSVYFDTMACFPYDTEVLMEDLTTKRISEIKKGDYVITHLGNKKRVTDIFTRRYKDDLLQIEIIGLYEPITCTPNHSILTERGWIPAQQLTTNDRVLVPLCNFQKDLTIKQIETNKDFLWFLGLYLAEGSLGKNAKPKNNNPKLKVNGTGNGCGNITFSLHQKKTYLAERIKKIGKELFDTNFNVYEKQNSNGMEVRGYNVNLRDLLEELGGEYCYNKRLNTRLLVLEPELQLEIIKGWLDGDGNFDKKKRRIIGVSTSKELIRQTHLILLRNKIKSSVYKRKAFANHKEAYEVRIYGTEINKLYDWQIEPRHNNQKRDSQAIDYFEGNFLHRKITKIKTLKKYNELTVYNLEVEEDHSYIVNTVAVHNCVTFSALNALEILIKRKYRIEFNFSDRFTAKMSGTTKQGNYLYKVADSIRKDGFVDEVEYPYPREQRTPVFTWEDYYQEIPQILKDIALMNIKDTLIQYEQVSKDYFKEALKEAPIQVTVRAWYDTNGDLIYENSDPKKVNHAVVLIGYKDNEYWEIYDSYDKNGSYIKKLDWSYAFGQTGFKYNLTKKNNKHMITYKKVGNPAVYFAVGKTLIPFATTWENYLKDFSDAIIIELPESEFNKFKIANTVKVTAK